MRPETHAEKERKKERERERERERHRERQRDRVHLRGVHDFQLVFLAAYESCTVQMTIHSGADSSIFIVIGFCVFIFIFYKPTFGRRW